jgi:hypothetical protein
MIVTSVMDEQANALRTVANLNVLEYEADKIAPPAATVGLPLNIAYDQTFGRGMDEWTQEVTVFVSEVGGGRVKRDAIAPFADGAGVKSIKVALEQYEYTSCSFVQVRSAQFVVATIAGTKYLAVVFTLYVGGSGG